MCFLLLLPIVFIWDSWVGPFIFSPVTLVWCLGTSLTPSLSLLLLSSAPLPKTGRQSWDTSQALTHTHLCVALCIFPLPFFFLCFFMPLPLIQTLFQILSRICFETKTEGEEKKRKGRMWRVGTAWRGFGSKYERFVGNSQTFPCLHGALSSPLSSSCGRKKRGQAGAHASASLPPACRRASPSPALFSRACM